MESGTSVGAPSASVAPADLSGLGQARFAVGLFTGLYLAGWLVVVAGVVLTIILVSDLSVKVGDIVPIVVSVLVLLTLRPRAPRFVQPGPRLIRGEQPELFKVVDEATDTVNTRRFDEVYIDGSAEAGVAHREAAYRSGTVRTLVIGSVLLRTMTVDHLKALVAHESLRYYSPEHKLPSHVERMRVRLRAGLDDLQRKGGGSFGSIPFQLLAKFFMGRTDRLSHEYRLLLDDVVLQKIGGWQIVEMLKMTSGLPAVLEAYRKIYAPDGPTFEQYVISEEAARTSSFSRFKQSQAIGGGEPAPEVRLARLAAAARDSRAFDERPVSGLIRDFENLSGRLMADRFARLASS